MALDEVRKKLKALGSPQKAAVLQGFFKTGPGEYGEGDIFLGAKVPEVRKLAKEYEDLTRKDVTSLLRSSVHEDRLLALLILVRQFQKGGEKQKKGIYDFYLKNTRYVNNWDLVDLTANPIVGEYLMHRSKAPLQKLARSEQLWQRRIAIVATLQYIRSNQFSETLRIAKMLLHDEEDLIHKAVGWMLREVGKRDLAVEEKFLKPLYKKMPRTMLRYAIERFPEAKRQAYLKGTI